MLCVQFPTQCVWLHGTLYSFYIQIILRHLQPVDHRQSLMPVIILAQTQAKKVRFYLKSLTNNFSLSLVWFVVVWIVVCSGVATGGGGGGGYRGAECHSWQRKNCQKSEKKQEKREKIGKKRQKLGRLSHFAPPPTDRAGYATSCVFLLSICTIVLMHCG